MNKFELAILNLCEVGTTLVTPYISAKTAITVACDKGHNRSLIPSNLKSRGNGAICNECLGVPLPGAKTHETFTKQIQDKYPELKILGKYVSAKDPIEIGCTNGHTWKVIPSNLLSRGSDAVCSTCIPRGSTSLLSVEDINNRVQVHYPFLSVLKYSGSSVHATVLDSRCGKSSEAFTGNLMRGYAWKCVHCEPHLPGSSAMEQNLIRFIKEHYSGWIIESDKTILAPKHLDIVLPDLGLAIEFDGTYFHREEKCDYEYHLDKTKKVEAFGYRLIHIYDSEWVNQRKIVESRLKSILGHSVKIFARKCTLKEIDFPREFLNTNHIQGAGAPSSANFGLYYNECLVAVMTFSKSKFSSIAAYELVRFCSILGHTVIGGASKLLNAFRKRHPNSSIMSYSDKRWSTGEVYKTLGFSLHHTSAPGYRWYKGLDYLSRYSTSRGKLDKLFPCYTGAPELSEVDIMVNEGYHKVYDCGNDVWVLK